MSQTENYQELAGEFMRQWQQQMQGMMQSPEFAQAMMAGLQQMQKTATGFSHDADQPATTDDATATIDALRCHVRRLEDRLRLAEERIERLESERSTKAATRKSARSDQEPVKKSA